MYIFPRGDFFQSAEIYNFLKLGTYFVLLKTQASQSIQDLTEKSMIIHYNKTKSTFQILSLKQIPAHKFIMT